MVYKLPFPSLKNLSSLRICLHWADHRLGPFQDFPIIGSSRKETLDEKQSHLSIDGLPIPGSLKAVVGDVLCGILNQLCSWSSYRQNKLAYEVQFYHFDAFGRFDEQRTLKPVFQKKIAKTDDFYSLRYLLTEVYKFWLLPEVDAVLRKMVAIACQRRQSEILMEGPRPELRNGKYHLVYRIEKDVARSLKNIRVPVHEHLATIVLERESIAIAPCTKKQYWNFDEFKDHFDLFESSEREAWIEGVLSHNGRRIVIIDIKHQLDIFTFLMQKNYQQKWILKIWLGFFSSFFEHLLMWPYTSLVTIIFEYLAPDLEELWWENVHLPLFVSIITKIPSDPQYGVLHRNLLRDYWSVLTEDKKRRITSNGVDQMMEKLKVKAPFLHDTIKTEMDSLRAAIEEELLSKKKKKRRRSRRKRFVPKRKRSYV